MTDNFKGSCLCGAVQLEGRGTPRLGVCNCSMCLRWHGGPAIAVEFAEGVRIIAGEESIGVFDSSEWATRHFCKVCGSNLFYKLKTEDVFSPQAGLFKLPDSLEISEHIFIDDKPGWYDFAGDAPRLTGAETLAKYAGDLND